MLYRIELFFELPDDEPHGLIVRSVQSSVADLVTDQAGHRIAAEHGGKFCGRSYERMAPREDMVEHAWSITLDKEPFVQAWACGSDGIDVYNSIHHTRAGAEAALIAFLQERHGQPFKTIAEWVAWYGVEFQHNETDFGVQQVDVQP